MDSSFVAAAGDSKDHHLRRRHRPSPPQISPQNSFKIAHPSQNPPTPTCAQGHHHQVVPKCVCAPATHAGSFKCRLHRVNSNGPPPPASPPPPRPASSTRTVEAQ